MGLDGNYGELELLFVSPSVHSKGVGQAAWHAVERQYSQVRVWELFAPYLEKRNVHFYVNKLGFHIVEFFNTHHQSPEPQRDDDTDASFDGRQDDCSDEMLRYQKAVRQKESSFT